VRAAQAQELLFYQAVEDIEAGGGIGVPEAARLRERKPQSGHFHVLAVNTVQKLDVAGRPKPLGHGCCSFPSEVPVAAYGWDESQCTERAHTRRQALSAAAVRC
jgi:hypothetical protein